MNEYLTNENSQQMKSYFCFLIYIYDFTQVTQLVTSLTFV